MKLISKITVLSAAWMIAFEVGYVIRDMVDTAYYSKLMKDQGIYALINTETGEVISRRP